MSKEATQENCFSKSSTIYPETPKALKAVGRSRVSSDSEVLSSDYTRSLMNSYLPNNGKIGVEIGEIGDVLEKESNSSHIMDECEIKDVIDTAKTNPVTNDLIEKGKIFTKVHEEAIYKQCIDLVALYNIPQRKPFFFITPFEARMAIDYVKRIRSGHTDEMAFQDTSDVFIQKFISNISEELCRSDKIYDLYGAELSSKVQKDLDCISGVDLPESSGHILEVPVSEALNSFSGLNSSVDRGISSYYVYHARNDSDEGLLNKDKCLDVSLNLSFINRVFAVLERHDLCVDFILMNSHRICDIRNFGRTVHDEYSKHDQIRRRVFGRLFTAEIYPCNKLSNDQVIFGSFIRDNVNEIRSGIFLNVHL